jgi:hypothetical protein
MLFMGSGEHSAAECWKLVSELTQLLIDLSGMQQPHMSTEAPMTKAEQDQEARFASNWHCRAELFIVHTAEALGYKVGSLKRERRR